MQPFWHIACPVWGEPYRTIFVTATLPAVLAAIREAGVQAHFHVFTDRAMDCRFGGHSVSYRGVPPGENHYISLSAAHWAVLRAASDGDRVLLLNADIVTSIETIRFAEERFAEGRRAIVSLGVRALWNGDAPIGATAPELLDWCWKNLHPILQDCIWGKGCSSHPTTLVFTDGVNAQLHTFYLYPIMLVRDRKYQARKTIDDDLILNFRQEEYVVCGNREIGLAELSDISRTVKRRERLTVPVMARVVQRCYQARHIDSLRHGIRLTGDHPVVEAERTIELIAAAAGYS